MAGAGLVRGANDAHARGPSAVVLAGIALLGCAAAVVTVVLGYRNEALEDAGIQAALYDWITLPYILSGIVAWSRRPQSRLGPLMIAAGFAMFLSSVGWSSNPLVHTIGVFFDLGPAVVFLHVFLAFPSGRLDGWPERVLVCAGYFVAFGVQLVTMALGAFGPDNLLEIVSRPETALNIQKIQLVALSAISLAGIVALLGRRRGVGRPLRRPVALLVDVFALGLVMIAVLFLSGAFEGPHFETIRRATFAVIGLAPFAFLIGLLNARLARSAVGDLVVELGADPTPADLRTALARAVRDPSLELAYWLPEFETWADVDGQEVELHEHDDGRATTVIERGGEKVAVLVHDRALTEEEPELLDAVSAAAGIALENGRLQAELRARLEELRGSRGRVIEAGQKERQRLERNLHDGAQQRLVALSLDLSLLHNQLAADPATQARIARARREIGLSLEELRDVARGLHPAVVTSHGLEVALESLTARAPVPVRLTVELENRLPESLEVAAFYLVSECLANIGKHARATSATVGVVRTNGQVSIEIVDDGVGGADTERGSGLRGLADRVESLDGRLRVWTPAGEGTCVRAEIPCG
jgi:signal transduction histidine kinase